MKLDSLKKINALWLVMTHVCRHFPFYFISDKLYLKIAYRAYIGKKLDIEHPKTFNEKLQWLKVYDRNPEYTDLSDKFLVRKFVADKIGDDYLIPLLGCWDSVENIEYDKLPNQFVLKCNHDSGSVVICKDKKQFNISKANKKLKKSLKCQYYWKSREYNYKDIARKIIAEKYMKNGDQDELTDYKYFCFNGEPKFIQVDTGRFTNHVRNFYDSEWNYINVAYGCKSDDSHLDPKPEQHEEMLMLARKLSKNIHHVRVDFYVSGGKVYFGEMTFHHGGGFMKIQPESFDLLWGSYIDCKEIKKRK